MHILDISCVIVGIFFEIPRSPTHPLSCTTLQGYYQVPRVIPCISLIIDLCSVVNRSWSTEGDSSFTTLDNDPVVQHLDTSILHHAFISIFTSLWAFITHYISILMAILSYFTRFTMKRGNADSWNSGWKRSKYWRPILRNSKSPETPWNILKEIKKNHRQR